MSDLAHTTLEASSGAPKIDPDAHAQAFKEAEQAWAQTALNPFDPAFLRDPYPTYRRLLEVGTFRHPIGFWVTTRYEAVRAVLSDTRRFGHNYIENNRRRGFDAFLEQPVAQFMSNIMLTLNPPDHTRMRGLVAKAFTARRMEELKPRIQARVEAMLDALAPQGEMDLVKSFSHPLPVHVICDLMGIPEEDRHRFVETSTIAGRIVDPTPMSPEELRIANEATAELFEYFREFFERKRGDSADDLSTALVRARENEDKLSEVELYANAVLLFGAGHETTVNLITNSILALCRNPEQMAILRADPSLMPGAVEEFLRYDSSVQMTSRTAFEDVEVEGHQVAKGEVVLCALGAANHDPRVFEQPERLDVRRPNVRPLSFGGGIHFCLGAQLARIQGAIAVEALLRRLPGLRAVDPETPPIRPTFTLRGVSELPVVWDA